MSTIYLSGPMSGLPDFNRDAFFAAEKQLSACMDARFINPARINGEVQDGWQWQDYMRVALRAMMDADSIYMLDGWENSKGAQLELDIARKMGMPVYYQPRKLRDWMAALERGILILDTETTGLGEDAEIVEIAIIDGFGDVLLDTLVKPRGKIPAEVSQIHGITDEVVADAPDWSEVSHKLLIALNGAGRFSSDLVIWNAPFDLRMIQQTDRLYGLNSAFQDKRLGLDAEGQAICAQDDYRRRWGERLPCGRLKRQSLAAACKQQGIQQDSSRAHRALYDCQMTLEVIKTMAAHDRRARHENGKGKCEGVEV